jgi:SAM-dependent methyltransferase
MVKGNHMDQQDAWDREYTAQQLLSPSNVPHAEVLRFVRWLKKQKKKEGAVLDMDDVRVLDLGSGTGRNTYYFAEQGAHAIGYEFSPTALDMAKEVAHAGGLDIEYRLQDIGKPFPLGDGAVDVVLDVTSSNSLSDAGRATYLAEVHRVLEPGGYLFVRALSLEGDAHAKELVKRFPGPDPDTYVHPDLHLIEKVFTRESLQKAYGAYFDIKELKRVQHYATVAGRTYKRSYWVGYSQKRDV